MAEGRTNLRIMKSDYLPIQKLNKKSPPKLPKSCSEDGTTPKLRLKTTASRITSPSKPKNHKFSSLTLLADGKLRSSERLNAQSLKDSWMLLCSTVETLVRRLWPSESSDTLLKSFTSWPERTHSRLLFKPSSIPAQEKTPPESVMLVLPESKQSMSLQWEESTLPFTSSLLVLVRPLSEQWNPWVNVLLTNSWTLPR